MGVAPQYASALGKNANCQTLVSVTLASREVPIMRGLRLFLPESWTSDEARMVKAGVPEPLRPYRTKPAIAIEEIDRIIASRVRFGCVLADAGYGLSAPFRQALSARGLYWAVGIPRHQKVYPADVQLIFPWRDANVPGNAMFRTWHRAPRMPCSRTLNGDRSVGAGCPSNRQQAPCPSAKRRAILD